MLVVMEGAVLILCPDLPFLIGFLLSQTPQIRCRSIALGPEWEGPARSVGAVPVGNGKSLHCPQVLEALEPLTPEGPVVKVKSDFKTLVQGLIMFGNELPQACFV